MNQKLTFGLGIVVVVVALFLGFVFGRVTGQNALDFKGTSGKTLLYLSGSKAVEGLRLNVNLRGTVAEKQQDAILVRKDDDKLGVWATLQDSTVFEQEATEGEQAVQTIKLENINVGDKVVVLGDMEGDTFMADVVIREARQ